MDLMFWLILLVISFLGLQIYRKISPESFGGYCIYVAVINLLGLLLLFR